MDANVRKTIALMLLLSVSGCIGDWIPAEKMHRAIDQCETNGGIKEFKQTGYSNGIKVRCENGAYFYFKKTTTDNN